VIEVPKTAAAGRAPVLLPIEQEVRGPWNRRFVLALADGSRIESVLYRQDTLCVSSQVGCAVRCPFCASGQNGLGRSLTLDELHGQLATVRAVVAREGGPPLRGVTLSGIGEPLHNHETVARFAEECHRERLRVTLTTSGGPLPRLREWLVARPHHGLTLSVHAGTEAVRTRAVPHAPDLAALFAALHDAVPTLTRARRKKTALAYLVLEGVNDADAEIDAFVARARPLGLTVHLYAHNAVPESPWRGVDRARYEQIFRRMTEAGLAVRMSAQARLEANGGCGTLVAVRRRRDAGASSPAVLER
jgi:23S rRNA (adenine2503-C2)-methyltransferase